MSNSCERMVALVLMVVGSTLYHGGALTSANPVSMLSIQSHIKRSCEVNIKELLSLIEYVGCTIRRVASLIPYKSHNSRLYAFTSSYSPRLRCGALEMKIPTLSRHVPLYGNSKSQCSLTDQLQVFFKSVDYMTCKYDSSKQEKKEEESKELFTIRSSMRTLHKITS